MWRIPNYVLIGIALGLLILGAVVYMLRCAILDDGLLFMLLTGLTGLPLYQGC